MATKMTNDDKEMWNELCQYVKKDVLGYDENVKIPKFLILRLKGLSNGTFMANKKQGALANYSFKEILLTFKLCKAQISSAMMGNKFENEQHKINYIMIIVENNINDTVFKLKKAKTQSEKADTLVLEHQISESAGYTSKGNKKINDKLKDLW